MSFQSIAALVDDSERLFERLILGSLLDIPGFRLLGRLKHSRAFGRSPWSVRMAVSWAAL